MFRFLNWMGTVAYARLFVFQFGTSGVLIKRHA